ncbi:MAG: GNAT family N-acetyltransferase [Bacteroidia bacterium]|jgi:GNAT superfamily N-acetyltransferase|nr:GNAT family N-acetyltransferase [Bacteroidia bacterium]
MFTIRKAVAEDMPAVFELIMELAVYEKAPHEVINSPQQLVADGFGPQPLFGCFVAEYEGRIVGISLYYWRYSTWKAKRLYLEDIIVTDAMRGKGLGKLLMDRTLQHTLDEGCSGILWQVLDWNEPAINFYKKYNANFSSEWLNVSLEADEIKQLLQK